MEKVLNSSPDAVIMGEIAPYALEKAGSSEKAYIELLQDYGFELEYYSRQEKHDASDPFSYYDYFATKRA